MARRSHEGSIHYLHPDGWRTDESGATVRIRSRVSRRQQVVGEYAFEESDGRGGWRPASAPPGGSRGAEGWQWFAWQIMRRGTTLVRLQGVRPLDAEMARMLCEGLVPHDTGGRVLDSAGEAGLAFALTPDDARIFRERVLAAGGAIVPTTPHPGQAATAAGTIARASARARAAADESMEAIAGGNGAARISAQRLDELIEDAWSAQREAEQAQAQLERAGGALSRGRSTAEVTTIAALEIAALNDMQRIDESLALLAGAQREAALQFAAAESGPAAPPLLAPFDQWHAHMAARLRAQGQEATVEGGELVVRTPAGVVRLGKTLRIAPPEG